MLQSIIYGRKSFGYFHQFTVMQSLGHIAMHTLQLLQTWGSRTVDTSSTIIKTLLGQAIVHFSHPPQSSVLISMWQSSTASVFSFFLPLLKSEPKPIQLVYWKLLLNVSKRLFASIAPHNFGTKRLNQWSNFRNKVQ